jgi:hypothetical protein
MNDANLIGMVIIRSWESERADYSTTARFSLIVIPIFTSRELTSRVATSFAFLALLIYEHESISGTLNESMRWFAFQGLPSYNHTRRAGENTCQSNERRHTLLTN